jgi:hypothetical protein
MMAGRNEKRGERAVRVNRVGKRARASISPHPQCSLALCMRMIQPADNPPAPVDLKQLDVIHKVILVLALHTSLTEAALPAAVVPFSAHRCNGSHLFPLPGSSRLFAGGPADRYRNQQAFRNRSGVPHSASGVFVADG